MFGEGLQTDLFATTTVGFDGGFGGLERLQLDDTAWLDYSPLWLSGHEELFRSLTESASWGQPVVRMYDRDVLTPRLVARIAHEEHPVIPELIAGLSARYGVPLDKVSAGWYRDGKDSVAFHGDRVAREREDAIVATISLGAPRRFLIRPRGGGSAHAFSLGQGDLVVMGGSCQRTWEHAVPKTRSAMPRIALMFRHVYV